MTRAPAFVGARLFCLAGIAGCAVAAGCGERPARAAGGDEAGDGGHGAPAFVVDAAHLEALPADSLDALGAAAYGDERYEEARAIWELGLDLARRDSHAAAEAGLLTSLGLIAWRLGEFERAERLEREALRVERRAGLVALFPRTYNALGLIAWDQGRFSRARDWYDSTFSAARAAGDEGYHAKALVNLGNVETALGEVESARRRMHEGIETFRALEMPDMESRTLVNLAALERDAGNLEEALAWARQGLALARTVGDRVGEEAAFGQLATLHMRLGHHEAALAAADSALRQARRHGLRQAEAADIEILADLHHELGDLHRALRLYDSARAINSELDLQVETGLDLYRVAAVHVALGNLEAARERAEEALGLHRASGARLPELGDLLLLAEIAELARDRGEADARLEEAARLSDRLELRSGRVEVALASARVADRRADDERLLRILREVKDELPLAGFAAESEAAGLRARALRRSGELEAAEEAGRSAIAMVQDARGGLSSGLLRSTLVHSRVGHYADLVDVLLRQNRAEDAFEVAMAAGAMAARRGDRSGKGPQRREALLERIDALTAQVRTLERDYENPDFAEEPADRLRAAREEYAELTARDVPPVVDAAAVRSSLRPEEALLQFLVGEEQAFAFLVTAGGTRAARLAATPEALVTRVRLARRLLEEPARGDASPVLAAIYADLIGPFLGTGGLDEVERMILVPHGPLTYLPFAALKNGLTGRWLVEEKILVHLPSAALLAATARATEVDAPSAPAHAFAPLPTELPASRAEARAVARALGAGARLVVGREATEFSMRAALGTGGIVHVASHAELNPANPLLSAVVLAPTTGNSSSVGADRDGRLEVHELLGLSIRSPLVYLSGCETGLGTGWSSSYAVGEDFATLERALLEAGAGGVVSTLWRIADESAAEFATRFYRRFPEGADPADALAAAQREMMADPRWSHPFHWAAYRASRH